MDPGSLCCLSEDDFLSTEQCATLGGVSVPGSCNNAPADELCTNGGFELGTVLRDNTIRSRGNDVCVFHQKLAIIIRKSY